MPGEGLDSSESLNGRCRYNQKYMPWFTGSAGGAHATRVPVKKTLRPAAELFRKPFRALTLLSVGAPPKEQGIFLARHKYLGFQFKVV